MCEISLNGFSLCYRTGLEACCPPSIQHRHRCRRASLPLCDSSEPVQLEPGHHANRQATVPSTAVAVPQAACHHNVPHPLRWVAVCRRHDHHASVVDHWTRRVLGDARPGGMGTWGECSHFAVECIYKHMHLPTGLGKSCWIHCLFHGLSNRCQLRTAGFHVGDPLFPVTLIRWQQHARGLPYRCTCLLQWHHVQGLHRNHWLAICR